MNRDINDDTHEKHCLLAAVAATYYCSSNKSNNKFVVFGRSKNRCNPDSKSIALIATIYNKMCYYCLFYF